MDLFLLSFLLILSVAFIKAETEVKDPENEKIDVDSLFKNTKTHPDVNQYLAIRYASVTHSMREATFSEINDTISVNRHITYALHGPPFCQQAPTNEIFIRKDCLYLNIWTPVVKDSKKFKVLLWLVGGMFKEKGINLDMYQSKHFSLETNLILVTVQYRLGPQGFFFLNNQIATGNIGLKDQVLAIKWVNKYIKHFNGDENNVVLIGDEAGAASVGYHLLSPETSKLFKSAVMINGVPISEWAFLDSKKALERSLMVYKKQQCNETCIDRVDEKKYANDWYVLPKGEAIKTPFAPTEDSDLVPAHPLYLLHRATHLEDMKIIVGNSKNAGLQFAGKSLLENGCESFTKLPYCYNEHFKHSLLPTLQNNITLYNKVHSFYRNMTSLKYYHKILGEIFTDRYFRCPADEFVRRARGHGATVYQFEFHHTYSSNTLDEELKYFLLNSDDYTRNDFNILHKAAYQLAGFVDEGNPSTNVDKGWKKDEVFAIRLEDIPAAERTEYCNFLKENLPDYLFEVQSGQGSLKMAMTNLLITSVIVMKTLI